MSQVTITISEAKLAQLMELGVLSGSEISSEDFVVKELIQAMCLKGCTSKLCANCSFSDQCGSPIHHQVATIQATCISTK
jgi:hypothetical protein